MQSKAATIDEYLKEVPMDRLDILKKIRQICLQELNGYHEIMMYGGPCYARNNVPEVGFASQKHFIGLYILKKDAIDKYKSELKGVSIGKGLVRFSNFDKMYYNQLLKGMVSRRGISG